MMRKLLVVAAIAVFMMGNANDGHAQSLQIGNNQFPTTYTNNNDYGPIRNHPSNAASGRWAYVYPASLCAAMGNNAVISSLSFFRRSPGVSMPNTFGANLKIYMKNSSIVDFGTGAINWVTSASTAQLVFNGHPAQYLGSTDGFFTIPLDSNFNYSGGAIEMYIEYTQNAAGAGILFGYDNDASVPAYSANTTKYVINNVDTFASEMTNLSNLRKPTIRFNYPAQFNMGIDVSQSQQYANLGDQITPSVIVKNSGLQTCANITITASFPGASYTSSRQLASVMRDSSALVVFDAFTANSVATGQITYIVSVANDGFAGDDTLRTLMILRDPNATPGKFDNGPLITHPGQGFGGANLSRFGPPLSLFGSNANNGSFKIVDDFVLPAGSNWTIDSLGFFAYQTGSTTISSFNGLYVAIYDGDPSEGGQVVAGDDNASNLIDNMYFSGIYRASNSAPLDSTRPIIKLVGVFFSPVTLTGGQRYWMEWGFTGTVNSGPWQPAVSVVGINSSGNAYQKTSAGYIPMDGGGIGGYRQGAPFEVHYTINTTSVAEQSGHMRTGQVYPNPATNLAHISVALRSDEQVRLDITDLNGRVIRSLDQGMLSAGAHTINIETSDLPAGFYLLKVQGQNQLAHRKFQVIK